MKPNQTKAGGSKNETDTNVIQNDQRHVSIGVDGRLHHNSSTQNKESMLVASGFKVITPKTAAQQQKLQQLPPGHVAMVNRQGRTYYIFPDAAHNQAYVGGPQEYQAYQQLRVANNIAQENVETAQMYQDAAMNWGAWGGWGRFR